MIEQFDQVLIYSIAPLDTSHFRSRLYHTIFRYRRNSSIQGKTVFIFMCNSVIWYKRWKLFLCLLFFLALSSLSTKREIIFLTRRINIFLCVRSFFFDMKIKFSTQSREMIFFHFSALGLFAFRIVNRNMIAIFHFIHCTKKLHSASHGESKIEKFT